ncbi:MAG: GIY-YIG nuclease family protein [Peptococcaceae bacterium]|nr:MAG: GIY-YIG nuclease family protein [Peptococcaceae bacterium]
MALRKTGTYVLLLELPVPQQIYVGSVGMISFPAGFYTYTGSAMGGLKTRIARHVRHDKKTRWHIDFLLAHATIKEIFCWESAIRMECAIAQALGNDFKSVPRFGCSDCRCPSHLHYNQSESKLKNAIRRLGGTATGPSLFDRLN